MIRTRTGNGGKGGAEAEGGLRPDPLQWLTVGAVVYLALFLLVPLAFVVAEAWAALAGGGLQELPRYLARLWRLTRNSLMLASIVTATTLLISVPLAFCVVKAVPWPRAFTAALTVPLLSPPFIGSFALVLLLGRTGVVTHWLSSAGMPVFDVYGLPGLVLAHGIHGVPLAFLTVSAGLRSVPKALEEAAVSLGGSWFQGVRRVVLPYVFPYIAMAGLLVFLVSFGDVGAPLVIGGNYPVLPLAAYTAFLGFTPDPRWTALLCAWIVLLSAALLYGVRRVLAKTELAPAFSIQGFRYESLTVRTAGTIFSALIVAFLLLPYGAIAIASVATVWSAGPWPDGFTLHHYADLLHSLDALRNSLILAAVSTPIAVVIALLVGQAMRDNPRVAGVLDYVALLPFVLPGVVIGIGLARMASQLTALRLALPLMSGPGILIAALTVRRLPYPLRVLTAAYHRIDRRLEEASYSLGASRSRTLARVVLPQLYPALTAAGVIAFVHMMTELAATLILYRPGWETLAWQIFSYGQEGRLHRAAAISVLLIVTSVLLAALFNGDARRDGHRPGFDRETLSAWAARKRRCGS